MSGMRLVLLGPPGSGKGTLATMLAERLGVRCVSTGELFRREMARRSPLGRQVQAFVTQGRLVPDALVVKVVTSKLTPAVLKRGFVLDGFPRTAIQAKLFDDFLHRTHRTLHGAVYLTCASPVLVARLSGRRVCKACNINYHIRRMPPKRRGICDRCGSKLSIRPDDTLATIRRRLAIDRKETTPLTSYYRRHHMLHLINGNGTGEETYRHAVALLKRHGWAARVNGSAPTRA